MHSYSLPSDVQIVGAEVGKINRDTACHGRIPVPALGL